MKTGVAFIVALVLAVGATLGVFAYVNGVRHESQGSTKQAVSVIVSTVDIQPNTPLDPLISAGDFTTLSVPTAAVVTGAVTDISQLRGQTAQLFIVAGEQVTTQRLQNSTAKSGGPLGITEGYEALSLSLDIPNAGGGFVHPNDNVTIYASWDDFQIIPGTFRQALEGKTGGDKRDLGNLTLTVVPQARVLRVSGSDASTDQTASAIQVTLELTPQDAQAILQAQQTGTVWIVLLPPGQKGVNTPPAQISQILIRSLSSRPA
jgi:Flp pilus assembly protein CpaB